MMEGDINATETPTGIVCGGSYSRPVYFQLAVSLPSKINAQGIKKIRFSFVSVSLVFC